MKSRTTRSLVVAAIITLLVVMLRHKPSDHAAITGQKSAQETKRPAPDSKLASFSEEGRAEKTTSSPDTKTSALSLETFATPSVAERPYIRVQIDPDGSLQGIFATKVEPVKQARALHPDLGYYYRIVSPTTDETIIDGIVAKPTLRRMHHGNDHGVGYTDCSVSVLDKPVFFDIPNIAGRLEIYEATPSSPLAAKCLPLIKAVNLAPM